MFRLKLVLLLDLVLSLATGHLQKREVSKKECIQHGISIIIMHVHYLAPNYAPKNLDGNRLNVTHMNITWIKLSLEEARGVVTGYTVSYDTTDSHQRKEAVLEFAQPEDSYKVIGGLGFTTSYAITVSASTAVGQGISSPPIIVNGEYLGNDSSLYVCKYNTHLLFVSQLHPVQPSS